jgi:hypothetical protein
MSALTVCIAKSAGPDRQGCLICESAGFFEIATRARMDMRTFSQNISMDISRRRNRKVGCFCIPWKLGLALQEISDIERQSAESGCGTAAHEVSDGRNSEDSAQTFIAQPWNRKRTFDRVARPERSRSPEFRC